MAPSGPASIDSREAHPILRLRRRLEDAEGDVGKQGDRVNTRTCWSCFAGCTRSRQTTTTAYAEYCRVARFNLECTRLCDRQPELCLCCRNQLGPKGSLTRAAPELVTVLCPTCVSAPHSPVAATFTTCAINTHDSHPPGILLGSGPPAEFTRSGRRKRPCGSSKKSVSLSSANENK